MKAYANPPYAVVAVAVLAAAIASGGSVLADQVLDAYVRLNNDLGWDNIDAKEYTAAVDCFSDVIEFCPNYAPAFSGRAEANWKLGNYDGSAADYSQAIRIDPEKAHYHLGRGCAWYSLRQFDKAIVDFEAAYWRDRTDERTRTYLGRAYHHHGHRLYKVTRYAEGIDDMRKTLRYVNDDANYCNCLAWRLATCPEPTCRNGVEAISLARRACELSDWKAAFILETLAAAYAEAGRFSDAQRYQQQAVRMMDDAEAKEAHERLELYRQGKPYHEVAPLIPPKW